MMQQLYIIIKFMLNDELTHMILGKTTTVYLFSKQYFNFKTLYKLGLANKKVEISIRKLFVIPTGFELGTFIIRGNHTINGVT